MVKKKSIEESYFVTWEHYVTFSFQSPKVLLKHSHAPSFPHCSRLLLCCKGSHVFCKWSLKPKTYTTWPFTGSVLSPALERPFLSNVHRAGPVRQPRISFSVCLWKRIIKWDLMLEVENLLLTSVFPSAHRETSPPGKCPTNARFLPGRIINAVCQVQE